MGVAGATELLLHQLLVVYSYKYAYRHTVTYMQSILIYMYDCVNCCCRVQDGTGAVVYTVT